MHVWIFIAAFIVAAAAPFMDRYPSDGATFTQEDGDHVADPSESDDKET